MGQPNSGEAAVVGGNHLFGSCPPAEGMAARRWSSAPMRRELIGRQTCAGELNSCERMLAGGRRFPGGCIPAKPRRSEVIVFLDVVLRQSSPYRRTASAPVRWVLVGVGVAPGSSTPVSECWPEEDALREAELRRSRGCRR